MKRQFLRKCLTGVLCAALIFTTVPTAGLQVFAEETEVGESKEDMGKSTEDVSEQDGQDNELANNGADEEESEQDSIDGESEKDDINEGEELESEEKDNKEGNFKESESEIDTDEGIIDGFPSTEENELENSEDIYGEIDENRDKKGEMLTESIAEKEILTIGSAVSGTFGDTNWTISPSGRLTVEGSGEAGNTNLVAGSLYRTLPWYESRDLITSAEIRVTDIKDISYFFYGCSNLTNVDLRYLDTSNVIKMNSMFSGCTKLTSIEWGDFNTGNVKYMDGMFYGCSSLTSLDVVSGFDTSNVTNMTDMFLGCESLTTLNLKNFDTSNVKNMRDMFWGCKELTNLDLSGFTTDNVEYMDGMFSGCKKLAAVDMSNFDTSNVIMMDSMFSGCWDLKVLDLSNFNMQNVKNVGSSSFAMLHDCINLDTIYTPTNLTQSVELPLVSVVDWYRSDGTEVTELPQGLDHSIVLGKNYIPKEKVPDDGSKSNINALIAAKILSYKETYPEGYEWDKERKGFRGWYQCCGFALWMVNNVFGSYPTVLRRASDGELSNGWTCYWVNSSNCDSLVVEPGDIIDAASTGAQHTVIVRDVSEDGILSFVQCNSGGNNLVYWDDGYNYTRSNNTLPAIYKYSISKNSNYQVRIWKPSKQAKYAAVGMEIPAGDSGCSNPDVEGEVSTRPVLASGAIEDKSDYFQWVVFSSGDLIVEGNTGSFKLGENIIPWDDYKSSIKSAKIAVSGLTSAYKMFDGYNNLKEVDLSEFDTSQITDMSNMFYGCTGIESLDLSGFDTSQVTNMSNMFYGCTNLESLDLSSFNVASVTDWGGFLSQNTSLKQINTPQNLSVSVALPAKSGEDWYLPDGSKITELPKNSDVSVLITKKLTGSTSTESDNSGSGNTGESNNGENGNAGESNTENNNWKTSDRIDISDGIGAGSVVSVETWKPTTPDEKKRYAYVGNETVQYTLDKNNPYHITIEKAMQGPLCFDSFEAVLDGYTIGRTYNVYPYPTKIYSKQDEVQFTIKIPKAIYAPNRVYRMICVTKGGLPIVYEDLDNNPETITVKTNNFYAYALVYKEKDLKKSKK